jgi:hypothetical protein
MGRRRRLRKSGGGELEVNKQDVVASDEVIPPSVAISDEAILLPYVAGGDEGVVESHVAVLDAAIVNYPILKFNPLICYKDPIIFFIGFSNNFSCTHFCTSFINIIISSTHTCLMCIWLIIYVFFVIILLVLEM